MNDNKNLFENIIKSSGGKFDSHTLKNVAKTGDTSSLVNNLSETDKQKLNEILSNKESLNKILSSPQAVALMKMLKRGDKNG